jgi:adenosine deaminase
MLIGNLTKDTHPLPRFLGAGLNVVIGADDPGIFATSLAEEEKRLVNEFKWTDEHLVASQRRSQQSRSSQLVRRV